MYLIINDYSAVIFYNKQSIIVPVLKGISPHKMLENVVYSAEKFFGKKIKTISMVLNIPSQISNTAHITSNLAKILQGLGVDILSVQNIYDIAKSLGSTSVINIGTSQSDITSYYNSEVKSHNIFEYKPYKIIESVAIAMQKEIPHMQHNMGTIEFIIEKYYNKTSSSALFEFYQNHYDKKEVEMYLIPEYLGIINNVVSTEIINFTKQANKFLDQSSTKYIIGQGFIANAIVVSLGSKSKVLDITTLLSESNDGSQNEQSFISEITSLFKFKIAG